jgi:hypothetical protein
MFKAPLTMSRPKFTCVAWKSFLKTVEFFLIVLFLPKTTRARKWGCIYWALKINLRCSELQDDLKEGILEDQRTKYFSFQLLKQDTLAFSYALNYL